MSKRRVPVLSIVLYVLAGLLILYTIWGLSESIGYISDAIAAGQLVVQGNMYNIVNFYMSNCAQYALFAVILFTLGWGLQYFSRRKTEAPENSGEASGTDEDNTSLSNMSDSGDNSGGDSDAQL